MVRRKQKQSKIKGKRRQAKNAHRIAPMPEWFKTTPFGHCRWCNKPIYKEDGIALNMRRRWHPECVHKYLIVTDHRYAKREVKKRDKGICANCGKKCVYRWEWQCDHIIPLADRIDQDLSWFSLSNMQTLCCVCHSIKTQKENIARRKKKKKAKSAIKKLALKNKANLEKSS